MLPRSEKTTMRFMMLVKATRDSEAGLPPDPRLMEAVGKLGEEAVRQGTMVASGGLVPSKGATRIRIGGGKTTTAAAASCSSTRTSWDRRTRPSSRSGRSTGPSRCAAHKPDGERAAREIARGLFEA
jgi:hypothetical protein